MGTLIGIDMGGTSIKMGLIEEGEIVSASRIKVQSELLQDHLDQLERQIRSMLPLAKGKLEAIGIAFPSIVDSKSMKILSRYVKYTDAHNTDLTAWANDNFGVPLAIENDARAALIGEWQYGAGKDCDNLVLLMLGTGVGTAVLLDGKLLKGKHFFAGNLGGHTTINFNGVECNCGNIGCVETEGSTWALEQKIHEYINSSGIKDTIPKDQMNFEFILGKAKSGDELACAIRDNCLKAWSLCVINLIHSYDPERVILGGGIMKSKDGILPVIRHMVNKHSWCKTGDIDIMPAEQVEYAGILGMGHLVEELKTTEK